MVQSPLAFDFSKTRTICDAFDGAGAFLQEPSLNSPHPSSREGVIHRRRRRHRCENRDHQESAELRLTSLPSFQPLLLLIAAPLSFAAFSANHQSCDTQRQSILGRGTECSSIN
jgi:hypothetical protein